MTIESFLKTIYLGDRACKAIVIDSWKERVAIQVDLISRLKPGTKTWNFYADGDIEDGWLVFRGVKSIHFDPSGPLPNDFIEIVSATSTESNSTLVEISLGSVDSSGKTTEISMTINAAQVHLEDSKRPGIEITE